jgi:ribose 5-phosphate isomerase B
MNIIISNDHAGTELKNTIKKHLENRGHAVLNVGTNNNDSCDYPDYIHPLAKDLSKYDFGIIICGSANGVSMTANKYNGVRAAICWEEEIAKLARQHNNANILSLPARFIKEDKAIKITEAFLETEFEGGRHERRVNKIDR